MNASENQLVSCKYRTCTYSVMKNIVSAACFVHLGQSLNFVYLYIYIHVARMVLLESDLRREKILLNSKMDCKYYVQTNI